MPLLTSPHASRRQFLSAAGATVATLAFAPAAAAGQRTGGPLRLALLSDTHIPANPAEAYRGFSPVDNLAKVVPQVTAAEAPRSGGKRPQVHGVPQELLVRDFGADFSQALARGRGAGEPAATG